MTGYLKHPTMTVGQSPDGADVTALVLVGPPGAGKSTVRRIFSGYGLDTVDTTQTAMQTGFQAEVEAVVADAARDRPHCCVIDGVSTDEQLSYIRECTDAILTILVDTSNRANRIQRYIEQQLDDHAETPVVDSDELQSIKQTVQRREDQERPYPQHDLRLHNDADVRTSELTRRCRNIVHVLTDLEKATELDLN